jgi:acyl carrier protein
MTEYPGLRQRILAALEENPQVRFRDEHGELRENPDLDVDFADLGMDSLARMELSIWLELEFGVEIAEGRIGELGSLNRLVSFVAEALGSPGPAAVQQTGSRGEAEVIDAPPPDDIACLGNR